jgi:hypothetical protein
VLRVEHGVFPDGHARVRVIFTGHPADDTPPKTEPDEHTLRAAFVTLKEVRGLQLRGGDVYDVLAAVDAGAPVYPLSLLAREQSPWQRD